MTTNPCPPPYDAEIAALFGSRYSGGSTPTRDSLESLRLAASSPGTAREQLAPYRTRDELVPACDGALVPLTVVQGSASPAGPVIFHTHGGGMVAGDRWTGIAPFLDWIDRFDAVLVTVEYRLAPEFPDPCPREDAYAALTWAAEHEAGESRRIFVAGQSAGGGITAGLALMARDRGGPVIHGQLLLSPMLDHRNTSVSARQFDGTGGWDRAANAFGWEALLGHGHAARSVPAPASPAWAQDLSNLPPAFLECGTAEVFRDETVSYAGRLWESGNDAELHMWAGGFHRFDTLAPNSALALATVDARTAWLRRQLGKNL